MNKRNQKVALFILALVTGTIIFFACSKEEDDVSSLKRPVLKLTEQQITQLSERLKVGVPDSYFEDAKTSNGLVICTLWRKDKRGNCCKFGICEWFPKRYYSLDNLPERTIPCIIEKQKDGTLRPLIIELKEDVSMYPKEVYEFVITSDVEIESQDIYDVGIKKVILKSGEYKYDTSIGKFGGFVVPLYTE